MNSVARSIFVAADRFNERIEALMNNNDERDYAEEAANWALLEEDDFYDTSDYDDWEAEEEEPEAMAWWEAYELFDDHVNNADATVYVCGYAYDPAEALRQIDPIAYKYEFTVWADSEGIDIDKLTGVDREGN